MPAYRNRQRITPSVLSTQSFTHRQMHSFVCVCSCVRAHACVGPDARPELNDPASCLGANTNQRDDKSIKECVMCEASRPRAGACGRRQPGSQHEFRRGVGESTCTYRGQGYNLTHCARDGNLCRKREGSRVSKHAHMRQRRAQVSTAPSAASVKV